MNTAVIIFLLALTALVVATAATKSITGRSSRWDQMIHDHDTRHKRQSLRDWETRRDSCNHLGDLTQFDQLGRRNSGRLAPVGDQDICGSCWAFAAAHAVTDTRNIAAGRQLDLLSVQYTTRCGAATDTYGYGCCGGYPMTALELYRNTGVATDVCLPYNELSSLLSNAKRDNYKAENPLTCFSACLDESAINPGSIKIDGYHILASYNETTIMNALNNGHVVIIGIEVNMDLLIYGCGIFSTVSPNLDVLGYQSVVIVDYGTTDTGIDFWVTKNSWGSDYGESGYLRLRRGEENLIIGRDLIVIPLLSPDPTLPSSDPTAEIRRACAPQNVTQPRNNNITMSAIEYALQSLVDNQNVQCPNGATATGLRLLSFDDANIQVVTDIVVRLIVDVRVEGCGTTTTNRLDLTVRIDFDGMLLLYDYNIGNTAKILAASMLLMFAMVMISLMINN